MLFASHVTFFSLSVIVAVHLSLSHTQPAKYAVVLPTGLPLIKPWWLLIKIDNQKRELANKYASATKKQKVIILEVKCELNVNEVTGDTVDYWNHAAVHEMCSHRSLMKASLLTKMYEAIMVKGWKMYQRKWCHQKTQHRKKNFVVYHIEST